MNKKSYNETLTIEEITQQHNEWLLDKYVWLQRELGAIITEEKRNVKSEILRRMEKEQEVEKWKSSERLATGYVDRYGNQIKAIKEFAISCDADERTIQPYEILDLLQ